MRLIADLSKQVTNPCLPLQQVQTEKMSHLVLFVSFFVFISFASSSSSSSSSSSIAFSNTTRKCSAPQKHALLLFKQSLFSINDTSYLYNWRCQRWLGSGYYPIMMNWNNDINCCNWDGVSCNPFTGDVIGLDLSCGMLKGTMYLNTTLFYLPYLQRLNLAYNDFSGSQIGKFSNSLAFLNLSDCQFTGETPSEISLLSKLVSLDLTRNYFNHQNKPHFMSNLFQNCTLLEELSLNNVGLDGYLPIHLNISSLKSLDLRYNSLKGSLPDNIFDLQHLEKLDLSWNSNVTGPFPKVNRSTSLPLKWLGLSDINLSGEIPESISHFKSLNYLRLSDCGLVGSIPKSVVNLRHLTTLLLSNNMLNGTLPSSLYTLPSIEYIFLSNNMFSGVLPSEIFNCRSLKRLYLGNNQFDGSLELVTLLSTLPKLITLDLSYSGLSVVTTNAIDYVSPDINTLGLASCNLTVFPESIRAMKKLQLLDLSNNKIQGRIPDWAGEIGGNDLEYVDLSHNSITGLPNFKWYGLTSLYLQSNQIQGPFPPSICNMSNLTSLDMSKNNFGGVIPKCFRNNTYALRMLNLRTNQFNGTIPNVFSDCGHLEGLILNGNQLEGEVPSSLSKCQYLKVIDLGNNHFDGKFPGSLGDLPNLQALVLKSNNFHGNIVTSSSTVEFPFPSLRVLDLSYNEFVGQLPLKYFQNFNAMKSVVKNRFLKNSTKPEYLDIYGVYYSATIVMKGVAQAFLQIFIDYTIINLSNNRFEGEIPNNMGSLKSLKVLNLSHNNLNGRIPFSLGNLLEIESLDLSWNQLTGEIPRNLAYIRGLAVLNLSKNNLVGRIPQGKQFNTFDVNSFGGNSRLCGFPLPKRCERPNSPQLDEEEEDEDENRFGWKVVMLGYGCGTVIGIVLGYLMLSTGKPKWFNQISDAAEHMILKRRNIRR